MKRKEMLMDFLAYVKKMGIAKEDLVNDYIELKGIELLDTQTLLEVLPGKIRDKAELLEEKQEEKTFTDYVNKGIENQVAKKISSTKEADGETSKYKSVAAVERETKNIIRNNQKHKGNRKKISNLINEIKELERDMDFLRNSLRSTIAKTRLLGVE